LSARDTQYGIVRLPAGSYLLAFIVMNALFTWPVVADFTGRLAYTQWKGTAPSKYSIMDLPSGSVHDLSLTVTPGSGPQWSPDGQWLTFSDTSNNVFKVRPDGSGLAQLTQGGSWVWPCFSPDGSKIVYSPFYGNLYTMTPDGANKTQLPVSGTHCQWSPGSKILYTNWGATYDSDIFFYDPFTQTPTQVTHHVPGEAFPFATWSPEGEKLAVQRLDSATGLNDILLMNPDGSGSVNITAGWTDTNESGPCWSPDGQYVLFQSNKGGNWDIWAMRADGIGVAVNLTNTPDVNEIYPAMTPEPATLALLALGGAAVIVRRKRRK